MSLEPGWASTMFPVIFAVNQFLTCFAFSVACFLFLVGREPFRSAMRPKFQIDMGSLMLAFTLFWSYTSFSQMMLIWIGNLPEEIPFFLKRSAPGWWAVSAGLIVFHFAVPFLLLLFRDVKLHPVRLRVMATYLLVVCAVDVVWWVEPTFPHHSPLYVLMDVGAVVGIGGVWGLGFLHFLKQRPLLPVNELYYLPEGHGDHH
jgi:magnesium-transporting ATPase (P-type)